MSEIRYAVLEGDVVVNTILWDGEEPYAPAGDQTVLIAPDDVSIGWTVSGGDWIAPASLEEPPDVALEESRAALRAAAMANLMAGRPLTEDQARVLVGLV